jgi:serine/threonine protein kinase
MIGETIAHYRIAAKLGEGGMGEVYRAIDTKLGREVALKILPEHFAQDADRMARFEREAKLLASLNHPNIAQIYGVEERALVMELVEGESPKGPLPLEDAWKIASQIASALEYAHEKGIVHRDLKPANVKVTPDGIVKLLDFGLAKAFTEPKEPSGNAEQSPTLTLGATEVGVILGTAAYMAPEQAKGKSVDKRADIWAFGVVLYELLTGERLFKGEDVADTLAQVLSKEPQLDRVPVKARGLLAACLKKDLKNRLQAIGDAQHLLGSAAVSPQADARGARKLPWVLAAIGIAAALVMGIYTRNYRHNAPPPGHVQRYTVAVPEHTTLLHSFAISPDGRLLAIAAEVNGKRQLWLRAMDSFQIQPMPGTDDASYPFWSPDSRSIGFFAHGKLQRIASVGGPVQSLCNAPAGLGGSWNTDDIIVFSPRGGGGVGLQRVSAAGGVPTAVTQPKGISNAPVFLPDGRHFLYHVAAGEEGGVYLGSLDGETNRRVLADASSVFFAAGRLLFTRENALLSQPFDAVSGQTRGEISPIAERISFRNSVTLPPATVSQTGLLVYASGGNGADNQMAWYDRGGKSLGSVGLPGVILDPAISPDEKSVLFRRNSHSGSDLWLWDLTRQSEQRFTTDPSYNFAPFWSPQGDRIVFASIRDGFANLYQKATNGTGKDEQLFANSNSKYPTQWSRDGRFIVYSEDDPKTGRDIWVLPMDGVTDRKPVPFLRSKFDEFHGQLSPDSHWIAFTSDESGRREVYVQPFPEGEGRTKISTAGGEQPRWRGDGKELFFVNADGKMMAVTMKVTAGTKPVIEPGRTQALFEARLARPLTIQTFEYDVTADGKRFLLDTVGGDSSSPEVLNVAVNWDAELKK